MTPSQSPSASGCTPLRRRWDGGRWLNTLTTCPFCLSVWFTFAGVGWMTWMILPTWPGWGEFLLAIPAAAGVAAILAASDMALTVYAERTTDK